MDKNRFYTGLTYKEFLKDANEQYDLYEHHYKRTQIDREDIDFLNRIAEPIHILIITEAACPDSAVALPVIYKWVENHPNIQLRILSRNDNMDVMNLYLTNGAQAIPKVVIFDKDFQEIGTWGPRPKFIQDYFNKYRDRIKSGEIAKTEVHKKMRAMYAKDRGRTTIAELKAILAKTPEKGEVVAG